VCLRPAAEQKSFPLSLSSSGSAILGGNHDRCEL
jgi:hypothetical protein